MTDTEIRADIIERIDKAGVSIEKLLRAADYPGLRPYLVGTTESIANRNLLKVYAALEMFEQKGR